MAAVRRRVNRSEAGSGPISTWIGFVVFLGMLLFTVQAILNLYATTVLTSVAYDAARIVAESDGGTSAIAGAEAQARQMLGRFSADVTFDWSGTSGEDVVLRVQGVVPSVLLTPGKTVLPFGEIDRTVRLRVERFR
ncbi:MAG: hypothetical protein ACRD2W_23315 [Acidimicrobiales bacterium]